MLHSEYKIDLVKGKVKFSFSMLFKDAVSC